MVEGCSLPIIGKGLFGVTPHVAQTTDPGRSRPYGLPTNQSTLYYEEV